MIANIIRTFFQEFEKAWNAFPTYVKVFIYSVTSTVVGFYIAGEAIQVKTVVIVVATNLGIYKGPRVINTMMVKK